MPLRCVAYEPRAAERGVLYRVIEEHLEHFLDGAADHADGTRLPKFVESAARLVDHVLPCVPVRQWVLSLPYRLRYLLAWNHDLCRAVLGVYVRALLAFQRRRARRDGIRDGRSGCLTVIQRFGGGLNLNVHFHTLVLDGVFTEGEDDTLHFQPTPSPTDEEIAVVLATIATRVRRLLRRHGLDGDADIIPADPIAEESPALAGISRASIQGRVARAPACGAWARTQTPPGCSPAPRDTRISRASTSTPISPCPPATARGSSSSAAICCVRRWPRIGSDCWTMAASCSRSRPHGQMAPAFSASSPSNCSRNWPP